MAIRVPVLSVDDHEYYPLHEEQRDAEAQRRGEAEERAAELERQLAELRAGQADRDDRSA